MKSHATRGKLETKASRLLTLIVRAKTYYYISSFFLALYFCENHHTIKFMMDDIVVDDG
jgi:hypothetical protein